MAHSAANTGASPASLERRALAAIRHDHSARKSASHLLLTPREWSVWPQFVLAFGVIGLALAGRWLMDPLFGDRQPFVTLIMVLLPLVLLVRPLPFFIAALIGLAASRFLFLSPRFSFEHDSALVVAEVTLYGIAISAAGFAAWISHRARVREQAAAERAALNEGLLSAVFEQSPVGLGVMDTDGRWTISNEVMDAYVPLAIPSLRPDGVKRWRAYDDAGKLISAEDWPGKRALRGETTKPGLDMIYTDDTGGDRWTRVSGAPLHDADGLIVGAIAVVQDIDKEKRANAELRDADKRKNEFLAMLAHELRNPLASLRNVGVLLSRFSDPEKIEWCRQVIERQTTQMAGILEDLFDISRISQGKLVLSKSSVPLAQVLRTAAEMTETLIKRRSQELVFMQPPESVFVDADQVRLAQVFSNLLTNAAKYSEEKTTINVAVERIDRNVRISVRDQGIGISADKLSSIFDIFSQVEPPLDGTQSGLGLGLALVRTLVELHGGTIHAQSAGAGQGSEFAVTLPVSAPGPMSHQFSLKATLAS
jgi:signal transduction histidine kinase